MNKNTVLFSLVIILAAAVGAYFFYSYSATRPPESSAAVRDTDKIDNAVPVSPDLTWEQLVARHPDEPEGEVDQTLYACDGDKNFLARVEVKPEGSGKAEVFLKDGTRMLLSQTTSASGARYANSGGSFVFWTKGNTAFIQEGSATPYENCVVK